MSRRISLLVVAAVLSLAGCGGGNAQPGGQTDQPKSAAFPVTVEHKLGTTEIKSEPKKVVTLGLSDHDAVVALGIKPVGVIDWFKERPWGKWPWLKPGLGDTAPEIVGERDEYNVEKIAALKPDLILAHYSGIKKEQYDTLSQIAPVVAQVKGFEDYGAPWQEMAKLTGKALGKSAEIEKLIKEMDDKFAAVKQRHPEWQGKTAVVADAFEPGKFSVFAAHDPKMLFFSQLGFKMPDVITKEVGKSNVVDYSMEKLDVLESDRLVWLTSDPRVEQVLRGTALYNNLKVVQDKRDLFVPYEEPPVGAAISFNTVLSIPYALENMEKLLSAQK